MTSISSFPPFFGRHRKLELPPLEAVDLTAGDGTALRLHRACGGPRGPVLLAPGTAMSGLSLCLDTVRKNLTEFLHAQGFDVWLLDWRSSPYLPAHRHPYTLADVAAHDWPAAVAAVRERTGAERIGVLAHCLSAPALLFSLLRGHLQADHLAAIVLSQVAVHFALPALGRLKSLSHLDALLPEQRLIHLVAEDVTLHAADAAITALAALLPPPCDRCSCQRQSATFGGLLQHDQVNEATHALMGELIPEVSAGFLRDVVPLSRRESALSDQDERHLSRLALPITLLSGEHNQTFLPAATEASYRLLCAANGPALYRRHVLAGYGHLDCLIGQRADQDVFPLITDAFLRRQGP
jgi:cholesterol oxidase